MAGNGQQEESKTARVKMSRTLIATPIVCLDLSEQSSPERWVSGINFLLGQGIDTSIAATASFCMKKLYAAILHVAHGQRQVQPR